MTFCKGHIRGVSRLMAGLFAVQLVLTGFCLLTADAHAMPMSPVSVQQSEDMTAHCAKSFLHDAQNSEDETSGCFHCDDSELFVKAAPVDIPSFSPVLALAVMMPEVALWTASDSLPVSLMPTGPPGSAALLYTTSQRILI